MNTGKEIRYFEHALNLIKKDFNEIIRLNLLSNVFNQFDTKFKNNNFSNEKKIEFIFKAFYDIHFLEVSFPEENKILDEVAFSVNQKTLLNQYNAVRFHQ